MAWGVSFSVLSGRSQLRLSVAVCALAGLAVPLLFPPGRFGFYPVCPIHAWTGLLCPGCGGTRALAALLHGRFNDAWRWNQMVVAGVPWAVGYGAMVLARGRWVTLPRGLWTLVAGMAAGFTLWRNLP